LFDTIGIYHCKIYKILAYYINHIGINIYIFFVISIAIAKAFGKDSGFGIGLALLGFIFYPILGFGSSVYKGTDGSSCLAKDIESFGSGN
jgi:hypothetical protein